MSEEELYREIGEIILGQGIDPKGDREIFNRDLQTILSEVVKLLLTKGLVVKE